MSPLLNGLLGVPGIFAMTGVLALLAMLVVRFVIADPAITRFHSDTEASSNVSAKCLRNKRFAAPRLRYFHGACGPDVGIHASAFLLQADGLEVSQHWKIYLLVMFAGFVLMLPLIVISEKMGKVKQVFLLAIALAAIAQAMLFAQHSLWGVTAALLVFLPRSTCWKPSCPR